MPIAQGELNLEKATDDGVVVLEGERK